MGPGGLLEMDISHSNISLQHVEAIKTSPPPSSSFPGNEAEDVSINGGVWHADLYYVGEHERSGSPLPSLSFVAYSWIHQTGVLLCLENQVKKEGRFTNHLTLVFQCQYVMNYAQLTLSGCVAPSNYQVTINFPNVQSSYNIRLSCLCRKTLLLKKHVNFCALSPGPCQSVT